MLYYGSFAYFLYIFFALGSTVLFYFVLKDSSAQSQKAAVFLFMCVNVFQHLFKPFIWPHLWGESLGYSSTVYNMCAFLIVASPFIFLSESTTAKNFVFYVGGAAGFFPILLPHWLIGRNAFDWEVIRFYVCHSLLFTTSVLPALLKLIKLDYRTFWKIPFFYFFGMAVIIFNDVIMVSCGLVGDKSDLYGTLYLLNPVNIMHPPAAFPFMEKLLAAFSPAAFSNVPFLWQAIPMCCFIALTTFVAGGVLDRKHLKRDVARSIQTVKAQYKKRKQTQEKRGGTD